MAPRSQHPRHPSGTVRDRATAGSPPASTPIGRRPLSGVRAVANRVHRGADRVRARQVLQRDGRLAALPRSVDQRHRARLRPGLHVRRRRDRDPRRPRRRAQAPLRRLHRRGLAGRNRDQPADRAPASTTSRCATSGSCSRPSPSPASLRSTTRRCDSDATERLPPGRSHREPARASSPTFLRRR